METASKMKMFIILIYAHDISLSSPKKQKSIINIQYKNSFFPKCHTLLPAVDMDRRNQNICVLKFDHIFVKLYNEAI